MGPRPRNSAGQAKGGRLAVYNRSHSRTSDGFTLIEIVVALAVLGVGLFILLETQFASLDLFMDAEEAAMMDILVTQAVGIAEAEVLEGNTAGSGDFGSKLEGYTYDFTGTNSESEETPGLIEVNVTVVAPQETREIKFLVYDGLQIEL